jgi:hypothetical protein
MNRHGCIALMVVSGLAFGAGLTVRAQEESNTLVDAANNAIVSAEVAVEESRISIENGKQLVALIPEDSPVIVEVLEILKASSDNWTLAVAALEGAKQSADKINSASNQEIAQDYKLLAQVNAGVALSGAKVVQVGLLFVEAAANNKTESLDIIRVAMQDSLAAASQVQFNYERVKSLIAEKYSK